jgi:hypothetical protein
MRRLLLALVLCFSLSAAFAWTEDSKKIKVTIIENVPMTSSYNWEVEGKDSTYCYSTGCTSHWTLPDSGTVSITGATLKLLLPDGRIVIAQCVAKANISANIANALADNRASTVYRDCRRPWPNDTIYATFKHSQVKLSMQAPSLDGTGVTESETYSIVGVLQPSEQPIPLAATQAAQFKTYSYPSDGFSVSCPSEPHLTKNNVPTPTGTVELRLYFAQDGQTGMFVTMDDRGIGGLDSDAELQRVKDGFLTASTSHLLSEKKIILGTHSGIEFEAESAIGHYSARFYLVGTKFYKTAVVSRIGQPYPDALRFLDSFQLIPQI